ncbi:MAG TPA: LPS export ABC transporter periplasmic protein LptC [Pseudolabrys sp.]|nr:LPS export ABC transporter periplasmic protein LptC [Pseudolabrys sp.]
MNHPIAARSDPQTARAYWTMSRGSAERAFRAARRHSRIVRILRVALPAAVALALAFVIVAAYFNPLRVLTKLPIDIGNLVVSGTKITMEQPRLSGFTRDGRAYEVTATAAAQDVTKPDIVELHDIHAKVQMQDKGSIQVSAATGIYDTKGETLRLAQDIVLTSSAGYECRLSEALVDTREGNVLSEHPVAVKVLQGTLNANRLEVVNSGDLVRFGGGVDMVLTLNQPDAGQNKAGAR